MPYTTKVAVQRVSYDDDGNESTVTVAPGEVYPIDEDDPTSVQWADNAVARGLFEKVEGAAQPPAKRKR